MTRRIIPTFIPLFRPSSSGVQGPQGEIGPIGPIGPPGIPGYTPIKGLDYFDGTIGVDGAKGDKGDPGERGPQGIPGNNGYTPVKGVDYFDGGQGIQGIKGDTGDPGTTDYTALSNKPTIPTTLAALAEDATHRHVTDTEKTTWNGKQPAGTYSTDIHSNIAALNAVSNTNTGDNATNTQYSGLAASKQDTLVSASNIKTINGVALLGSGDIGISAGAFTLVSATASSSATALADVAALSFDHVAGKIYRVEIIASFRGAATTTGGKLAVYLPSGSGTIKGFMEGDLANTAVATGLKAPIYAVGASNAAGSFLMTTGVTSATVDQSIIANLIFKSTVSGVFRVQWASEVAASAATLNADMLITLLN